jgi:cell division control protein 45
MLTIQYEPSDTESDDDDDDDDADDESEDEADQDEGGNAEEVDEDDEEQDRLDGEQRRPKRRREGSSKAKQKRRRKDDDRPRRLPKAVREAHYDRIQKYYESGTHYGMSVAQTVYLLATVLERADNDLLWMAILGITYQYISARSDRDRYEAYHGLFLDEVARLNHETIGLRIPNPDDRSIAKSEELRFMLFRHWNLYDAMLHSAYVAGRMGIWKEKGRKRLQGLLAKMGYVKVVSCLQTY